MRVALATSCCQKGGKEGRGGGTAWHIAHTHCKSKWPPQRANYKRKRIDKLTSEPTLGAQSRNQQGNKLKQAEQSHTARDKSINKAAKANPNQNRNESENRKNGKTEKSGKIF